MAKQCLPTGQDYTIRCVRGGKNFISTNAHSLRCLALFNGILVQRDLNYSTEEFTNSFHNVKQLA